MPTPWELHYVLQKGIEVHDQTRWPRGFQCHPNPDREPHLQAISFCFVSDVVFPGVCRILNELCPNPGYPSPQLPMMKKGSPPFYFCLFGEESGVTLWDRTNRVILFFYQYRYYTINYFTVLTYIRRCLWMIEYISMKVKHPQTESLRFPTNRVFKGEKKSLWWCCWYSAFVCVSVCVRG